MRDGTGPGLDAPDLPDIPDDNEKHNDMAKTNTTKGQIGVTTENIFPVIKQFLYSDHEIFLRELVANAVDATEKLKALALSGEIKEELGDLKVSIELDEKKKILKVIDEGIGMTAEEVDKYINQIAFSSAGEFLEKYKDQIQSIIGHFGLGFYSAFMVSKKVTIDSLSWKEGSEAVLWTCDGSPEYEMKKSDKKTRGTVITLYLDDDSEEFAHKEKITFLLEKYCKFMPVPVIFGKEQEWKDGKYVDTDKDKVINAVEPLWTKAPSELKDEDYKEFYRALYPMNEEPLFWIHLNVDYPFTLTGILYFPKIKNNLDIRKDRIQLYCNQVYVTDSVEGVVPDWLMLLQGVIDSPDIPLNVSRSYLQSDRAVKKISTYITKKVASRLEEIAKNQPGEFEKKWNDIKIFIEYGMLSDEKFCESGMKFALLENTDGKYFKIEDYRKLIEGGQTDKEGNLICLYATDKEAQYAYVKAATDKGYDVLMMNGELDVPFVGMLEQKNEKMRFVRVDSDVLDNIIRKEDEDKPQFTPEQQEITQTLFKSQLPPVEKAEFMITFAAMSPEDKPVVITQAEYMRRMKDMARFQPGMSFYGEMPDMYSMVLNTKHPLVQKIVEQAEQALDAELKPVNEEISATQNVVKAIRDLDKDNKGVPDDKKKDLEDNEKRLDELRKQRENIIVAYAAGESRVHQLIDIALLGNNMLKGEGLDRFLKRSIGLLK